MEVATKQEHEKLKELVSALVNRIEVLESRQPVEKIEVAEAASKLKKCEATVRRMAKSGELEMIRDGHKIYVSLQSVHNWDKKHFIKQ